MKRRSGSTIGGMLANIAKTQNEYRAGKIRVYPNGWIISDAGFTNVSGVHFAARSSPDGTLISLKPARFVAGCPAPPSNSAVTEKGAWVPIGKCQRCPEYIKGGYCAQLREMRRNAPSGVDTAMGIVMKATSHIVDLMERAK